MNMQQNAKIKENLNNTRKNGKQFYFLRLPVKKEKGKKGIKRRKY